MKQQIISALRTKYQRFGLSNEAVDRIASAKEKTVNAESDIEAAIADAETMTLIANELQKSADYERRTRSDLQKSYDEYREKHPETNTPPTPPKEDEKEPEWAKKLREQNEAILARQQADDDAKAHKELSERMKVKLKESGCNHDGIVEVVLKSFGLKKDENEDAAILRLVDEYNATKKLMFGDGPVPQAGGSPFGDAKTAIEKKNASLRAVGLLPAEK